MQVLRGIEQAALPPCVLTIGNFDGLHLGHAAMLAELKQQATRLNLPSTLLTFEPHPRELFTPQSAPARLTNLREKIELLAAAGVDYLVVQRFDRLFAAVSAETFRDEIIARRLNARLVLVGDDFRFGARRTGDFALLRASRDFECRTLPTRDLAGERISSTAVRTALADGDLPHAERLLGRPYSISGRVVHGDKLGRQFGYPTANVQLKHNRPPLLGIFVVRVHGLGKPLEAVASLGFRPTVRGGDPAPKLEVHIFDFSENIYGQHLRIEFLAKLRDEQKFPDFDALIRQIDADCVAARHWFSQHAGHKHAKI